MNNGCSQKKIEIRLNTTPNRATGSGAHPKKFHHHNVNTTVPVQVLTQNTISNKKKHK
jgi:hypothetical protein